MKKLIFAVMMIGSALMTQMATAQTRTPYINHRQAVQSTRIHQGMRSGTLTRNEARHLSQRERHIRMEKAMYARKGYVTAAERRHMIREQNRTSNAIYRDKHNGRVRY